MSHPAETELAALLVGQLPEATAATLAAHIDRCPDCRATLERLTTVSDEVRASLVVSARTDRLDAPAVPQIPGYADWRELGRGGCGVVYRARDIANDRLVAVKVLRAGAFATAAERAWFRAEAEAAARLTHPNVVAVVAVGGEERCPYYVMEYAFGGSLAARLDGTPLPPATSARLVQSVAGAVHFAHAAGVIHRDIKPGNILLDDGDDPLARPKVGDFGMAKTSELSAFPTPTHAVVGTPSYMAPEQAFGRSAAVGPPADVYALGAVLYELLTGRPPFKGETPYETLLQVRSLPLVWPRTLRPDLPAALEAVCLKCLERRPEDRYATAEHLADDLGRFIGGRPVSARHPGRLRRLTRWARGNRSAAGFALALVAVAVTAVVALTFLWVRADHQRRTAERHADDAFRARLQARKAFVLYADTAARLFRDSESITREEKAALTRFIREAEAVLSETTGDPDEEQNAAYALLQLADGLNHLREPADAVAPCRRGYEVLRRLAADHPDHDRIVFRYSEACSQLAGTLAAAGQTGEYEALVREAIRSAEVVDRRRPDDSEWKVALTSYEGKLAQHLVRVGKVDEAGERFAAAAAITRRLFDAKPDDPHRCDRHVEKLHAHARYQFFSTGDADILLAAARYQLRTFRRCKPLHPKPDWMPTLRLLASTDNAVVALDRTGRGREADELMAEGLQAARELAALDPANAANRHPLITLLSLDARRSWTTDPVRARASYNQAVSLAEQAAGGKAWDSLVSRLYLVHCLVSCPDPTLRDAKRAVEAARQLNDEPRLRSGLGIALFAAGDFTEAVRVLEGHIRWAESNASPSAQVSSRSYLARALWRSGQQDAARNELRRLEDELRRSVICEIPELNDRDAAWQLIEGKASPPSWSR
jgi:tetratricopeptide (TPR) repeat protein